MKEKISKILSLLFIIAICFDTFADMKVPDFNGVTPQSHINKMYSTERREELKKNIINYEDIEDMIHIYNPDVLNNWNSWENNKSANDIYSDYQDAADALAGGTGDSEIADAMANAQADAMRIQADNNYSDSYVNFISYLKDEKTLVSKSKILFHQYFQSDYLMKIAEENKAEAERQRDSAKTNYSVGNATKVDVLNAEKKLADAEAAFVKAKSAQNSSKRNLLINCGKSMNDDVTILPTDNNAFLTLTSQINVDADYEKALKNNIQYEIYKKMKENAQTTEVKNKADININAAPQKIYNDIEAKYNNITDAISSNSTKQIAYGLAIDTYNNAKRSYANGSISKKDYLSAEYSVNVAKYDLLSSYYDINVAYENYIAAVEGLASC